MVKGASILASFLAIARANPFVVGTDSYQRFVGVTPECTRVLLTRRRKLAGETIAGA
jgi:hypothetical protein